MPGAFILGLQTRPDQAAQAVQVSRDVVRRFVADGPTAAEIKAAKDFMIGGFALRIDSNRKLLDNLANIAWYDLPLDYLDTWTSRWKRSRPPTSGPPSPASCSPIAWSPWSSARRDVAAGPTVKHALPGRTPVNLDRGRRAGAASA